MKTSLYNFVFASFCTKKSQTVAIAFYDCLQLCKNVNTFENPASSKHRIKLVIRYPEKTTKLFIYIPVIGFQLLWSVLVFDSLFTGREGRPQKA